MDNNLKITYLLLNMNVCEYIINKHQKMNKTVHAENMSKTKENASVL